MQTEARIIRWNITDDERELGKRLLSDPDFCAREQKDFGSLIVMKTGLSIAVEPLPDSQWSVYVYHQYADFGMSRYTIRGVDVLTNFIYHVLVKEHRGGQNA